jgi:hypothetical protein
MEKKTGYFPPDYLNVAIVAKAGRQKIESVVPVYQ